ncbi:MAG: hemolysin III family protein [Actinomycetota bacterium]
MSVGTLAQTGVARPSMRGRLHQIAFICSIPMGITLVAMGRTPLARASAAVYALSLAALYGVSASYHRLTWSPRARRRMRRLDHSTIFVLIAGTYTPVTVLVLTGVWRASIMVAVWAIALLGITLKITRIERMDRLGVVLYVALGWTAIVGMPRIVANLSVAGIVLLVAGGVLHSAGAVVYARRRPDPNPRVFGYHEVFHSLVIAGSLCHYALITTLVLAR